MAPQTKTQEIRTNKTTNVAICVSPAPFCSTLQFVCLIMCIVIGASLSISPRICGLPNWTQSPPWDEIKSFTSRWRQSIFNRFEPDFCRLKRTTEYPIQLGNTLKQSRYHHHGCCLAAPNQEIFGVSHTRSNKNNNQKNNTNIGPRSLWHIHTSNKHFGRKSALKKGGRGAVFGASVDTKQGPNMGSKHNQKTNVGPIRRPCCVIILLVSCRYDVCV